MSDSTNPIDQVSQTAIQRETLINALFAESAGLVYGRRSSTCSGLTWGYYGGRWGGFSVANGTQLLTDSTTTYMVAAVADGVVSFSTSTTNWNNDTDYVRCYKLTAASGVVTYEDHRAGPGGVFGSGGSTSGTFTGGTLTDALNEAPITTLSSASTTNIGAEDVNTITISGTTTITAFDTIASGAVRRLVFSGVMILTHNGTSLILPTAANITTAAGDVATFVSLGSGNWRCVGYQRADGKPLRVPFVFKVAISDETTDITTGTAKLTFRWPYANSTIAAVRAELNTASSSGNPAFDVNEGGASIFSTTLTIDASEKTSTTAATPAVISDSSIADDAEVTVDIDTAGTGAKGAKITFLGYYVP